MAGLLYHAMSAHPTPHSSEDSGSFWSLANIIFAVIVGGFALFWGGVLFSSAVGRSSGLIKEEAKTTASAPAAEAPAAAAPAAPAAPGAAPTTASAAAAPAAAASADVAEVTIKPDLSNPLAYDTKEFKVKAGQKVKLTFNNTHPAVPQPHNIVIAKAGAKDKLLGLAMQMAAAPDGMAKGFIPDSPDILFHTKLLQPNTTETLEFTAPAAGDYPYLCTFPGHGILMNGVMKVE